MSMEVLGDGEPLGQFASNKGYSDLIAFARKGKFPAAQAFFQTGETEAVPQVVADLLQMAHAGPVDVASTALGLARLIRGRQEATISDGTS
ncbi:MAG: hypothetical protein KGL39_22380 [Patescibacteria group bacterium]|nr:hypothetical protein [Patescibacteria group bacterium]